MTSVQRYLKIVHDRSTPVWVLNLVGTVANLDICDALSGIEAVKEMLDAKFDEKKHVDERIQYEQDNDCEALCQGWGQVYYGEDE